MTVRPRPTACDGTGCAALAASLLSLRQLRLVCALVVLVAGCADHEATARAYLENEGLVDIELEAQREEGSFSYRCRRGNDRCVGLITVRQRSGGRSLTDQLSCKPDEALCRQRVADHCYRLGRVYDQGDDDPMDPTPRDPARAASFYEQACEAGHGRSCNIVGLRYAEGRGVQPDHERAASRFARSCELAHGRGCYNLALSYSHGLGVAQSAESAARYYRWACHQDVAAACYNLAVCYRDGLGVVGEPARAAGLFARACDLGYLQSCVNLGVMHVLGEGAIRDEPRAAALFRRACDAGLDTGCQGLRKLETMD